MTFLCVVLHMCWRERLVNDYTHAAAKWNAAAASYPRFGVYFVDSCRNLSDTHPFEAKNMRRIPFEQKRAPINRFYLTNVEMDQIAAALEHLPPQCTNIVKLTGKYFSDALPPYLAGLHQSPPSLAVQARGPSWNGWSSELFIVSRRLLVVEMCVRRAFSRTEEWLDQVRKTLIALNISVHYLPRFDLVRPVQRSGDFKLMRWL